jgi:hypothetical protein
MIAELIRQAPPKISKQFQPILTLCEGEATTTQLIKTKILYVPEHKKDVFMKALGIIVLSAILMKRIIGMFF